MCLHGYEGSGRTARRRFITYWLLFPCFLPCRPGPLRGGRLAMLPDPVLRPRLHGHVPHLPHLQLRDPAAGRLRLRGSGWGLLAAAAAAAPVCVGARGRGEGRAGIPRTVEEESEEHPPPGPPRAWCAVGWVGGGVTHFASAFYFCGGTSASTAA